MLLRIILAKALLLFAIYPLIETNGNELKNFWLIDIIRPCQTFSFGLSDSPSFGLLYTLPLHCNTDGSVH
jgi:hypothetical protein